MHGHRSLPLLKGSVRVAEGGVDFIAPRIVPPVRPPGRFLPENTPKLFKLVSVGEKPPPEFELVRNTRPRGQYRNVFDYKYTVFPEEYNFHLWAMLLWDRLIKIIAFHDPECECDICKDSEKMH